MRAAVYMATRNVYETIIPSLKSLLLHTRMDKVYIMIEDDEFPYTLPDVCEVINVSGQRWFTPDSPNFNHKWSYMVLLRVVLSQLLPDVDKVLSIDIDTIVVDDIGELLDMDLGNNFYAAVREPPTYRKHGFYPVYHNFGTCLFNLKLFRETGLDLEAAALLQTKPFEFSEQDCLAFCLRGGRTISLDSQYNHCPWVVPTELSIKVIHYAGRKTEDWMQEPLVQAYLDMPWDDVLKSGEVIRNES